MRSLLSTEVGREKVGEGASEWLAKFGAAREQGFEIRLLVWRGCEGVESSDKRAPGSTPISPRCTSSPVFTILVKRPPKTVDVASSSLCDRPHNEHDIGSIETDKLQGARPSLSLTPTIPTRLFS
jgi:hypothetical protein